MSETYITKSTEETINLGAKLAKSLKGGDIILLYGDLGAGKTQFTKGVAKGLGITEMVTSPTFTIERIYQGKRLVLHHFDLYRTHEDREIAEQISEFARSGVDVAVIEWPENMQNLTKYSRLKVSFEEPEDEATRKITIEKVRDGWS